MSTTPDTAAHAAPLFAEADRPAEETVMPATITQRDEAAGVTDHRYHYSRVVEIAGRVVRVRIVRDFYPQQCLAVAEVLADDATWTHVADDTPGNWWTTTPTPTVGIDAAAELSTLAQRLVNRAATILAPPPTMLPPHVVDAVGALLAGVYGYDGERRITPDDITWATSHGGPLHIYAHDDGSVTFTKAHQDQCPFVVSNGIQDCDDQCYYIYDGRGRHAVWLGSLQGNADPETVRGLGCGQLLLDATDPLTYADAVTDLLDVWTDEDYGHGYHPRDGWPWLWPDSRETDWVFTFVHGRVWITTGRAWLSTRAPVACKNATR